MADKHPSIAGGGAPTSPQLPGTNGNMSELPGPATPGQRLIEKCTTFMRSATTIFSPPAQEVTTSTPGSEPSAITATTTNTPAAAALKRPININSDDGSEQLSKKPKYADYTNKRSDDDSVVSADDESKWEEENNKMYKMAADANAKEIEAANNMTDPVAESFNFELMTGHECTWTIYSTL